jgi:DNA-binding GntR family transcriptional regulator
MIIQRNTRHVPAPRARTYGCAQGTAERAIRVLKAEGLVKSVRGKGVYVIQHDLEAHCGNRLALNSVQQLLDTEFMSVRSRPTEEDLRVIEAKRREGEKTSDVTRRALRLLERGQEQRGRRLGLIIHRAERLVHGDRIGG